MDSSRTFEKRSRSCSSSGSEHLKVVSNGAVDSALARAYAGRELPRHRATGGAMRERHQGVVQASGATIVSEHGDDALVLGSLAQFATLGLLRQRESWPARP